MTTAVLCVFSLPRTSTRLNLSGCFVRGVCFRNSALLRISPSRTRSSLAVASALDASHLSFSDFSEFHTHFGGTLKWRTHLILENSSELKNNVFSRKEFERFQTPLYKFSMVDPSETGISHASPSDLIAFVQSHVNTMGREDFQKICRLISDRLPSFSDHDQLELLKAFFYFNYGGNGGTLWEVIDEELLRRFDSLKHYCPTDEPDFFLQAIDVLYWLGCLSKSAFARKYMATVTETELKYPVGVQIMFYVSCGGFSCKSKIMGRNIFSFLNEIRDCPDDMYHVALECASTLYRGRSSLPNDLYKFLVDKLCNNIDDDKILTAIVLILSKSRDDFKDPSHFTTVSHQLKRRKHSIPPSVLLSMCLIMAKHKQHAEFLDLLSMEPLKSSGAEYSSPETFWHFVMNLYSLYGSEAVFKLANRINIELQKENISCIPEGLLLMIYSVLINCGIPAHQLWETTMQGDVLVPNFSDTGRPIDFGVRNGLHLTADDCIQVHYPDYKGSRLREAVRIQLFLENQACLLKGRSNPCPGLQPFLQKISGGQAVSTTILPGFMGHGTEDFILCKNKRGFFCSPGNLISKKPWEVKTLPAHAQGSSFLAVWFCPSYWPVHYTLLKHRTLQRLGYHSIMIDHSRWELPEFYRDWWLHSEFTTGIEERKEPSPGYLYRVYARSSKLT